MLQHLCNTSMQMDAFSYVFVQLIHTYTYMYFFFLRTIREKGMWNGPRYKFFTSDFRVQIVLSRVTFFADGNERVENRLDKEKEGKNVHVYSNFTGCSRHTVPTREHVSIPFFQGLSDTEENSMYQGTQKESPRLANK